MKSWEAVLEQVQKGLATRAEIAKATGLSSKQVGNSFGYLQEIGLIEQEEFGKWKLKPQKPKSIFASANSIFNVAA